MDTKIQPDLYAIYESCDPDFLRQSREAAGMDETTLARIACLSLSQVKQLQEGTGDGLFYSPTIRRQAYKRLLMILGAEPPMQAPVETAISKEPASLPPTAMLEKLDRIVAMSSPNPSVYEPAWSIRGTMGAAAMIIWGRRQLIGSFLLMLVALGALMTSQFKPEAVSQQFAKSEILSTDIASKTPVLQPAPALPVVTAVANTVPANSSVMLPAASMEAHPSAPEATNVELVASQDCGFITDKLEAVSAMSPSKPGNYVHVVAQTPIDVCIVDSNKKATVLHLKAGEGRSVYGGAPWQLSANNLLNTQIFFQGWRINVPVEANQRLMLVETRL